MKEHFPPCKFKFVVDFDFKLVMTEDEKVSKYKLVYSLMTT